MLSTVFGAAAAGGFASIPQSSFNYKPVGVNIEMTPRVTYEGEIILDVLGREQRARRRASASPARTCRRSARGRSTTRLRLREGESTCWPACCATTSARSLTGFPGVMRVPVLRSLFGQTNDEINQTDIVMLLTPHIVRTHELTVEDLSPIYIGTQQNVGLGGPPPLIAPQPVDAPAADSVRSADRAGAAPARRRARAYRARGASPAPGVPPTNPPPPPGTSPVPALVTPPPPRTGYRRAGRARHRAAGAGTATPAGADTPPCAGAPAPVTERPPLPRDPNADCRPRRAGPAPPRPRRR